MDAAPAYGSIGVAAFWVPPPLPTIVAVWISLFPLILHLASTGDDHHMIGELALSGRFQTGIFPRLGLYDGIARLLKEGPDFLDQASSQGTLGCTVWDVAFGSVFPCANAAARDLFTSFVKKGQASVVNVEKWLREQKEAPMLPSNKISMLDTRSSKTTNYSRYQTLHVIQCNKDTSKPLVPDRLQTFLLSRTADSIYLVACLGLATLLCLSSAFGTAAIVLSGGISRLMCRLLPLARPAGFPTSNEDHDACMLTAIHVNASTWYLYRGERGPIDWLLNKTMISLHPGGRFLYVYFKGAHFFQLLAMTYVASQQGWDGVCLFSLMILVWLWQLVLENDQAPAEWVKRCQIQCSVTSFELTGRTPLLGAIQLLQDEWRMAHSGREAPSTSWMNDIVVPTPRRDAWTNRLWEVASGNAGNDTTSTLSGFDQTWVKNNTTWTQEAADCMRTHLQAEQNLAPLSPRP
jgi:hypothetical protein